MFKECVIKQGTAEWIMKIRIKPWYGLKVFLFEAEKQAAAQYHLVEVKLYYVPNGLFLLCCFVYRYFVPNGT